MKAYLNMTYMGFYFNYKHGYDILITRDCIKKWNVVWNIV